MTTKIILYIGSDNTTKKISPEYLKKVEDTLSKYWDGFTLKKCKGYYKGEIEESLEAVIMVFRLIFKDLDNCIKELKIALLQDEIGCEIMYGVDFKFK